MQHELPCFNLRLNVCSFYTEVVPVNICNRKAWRKFEKINLHVVEHSKTSPQWCIGKGRSYRSAHAALGFGFHGCVFVVG